MPVLATPSPVTNSPCCGPTISTPVLAAVACSELGQRAAALSQDNGQSLLTRMRAVVAQARQATTINWTLATTAGQPIDLSDCDCSDVSERIDVDIDGSTVLLCEYQLVFRLQEYLSTGCVTTAPVTIINAAAGQVQIALPAVTHPGIYFGELTLQQRTSDGDWVDHFNNVFYVHIGRATRGTTIGPPSIAEVRLHLRDSHPAESYLLNRLRFDDAEIALATIRPVEYFNEVPPDLGLRYTTRTFPWRYHWLEGIVGNLFLMAAEQQRANQLNYSAGGIVIADQGQAGQYDQAAAQRLQLWTDFVRRKKAEINLQAAFGGVGSRYA